MAGCVYVWCSGGPGCSGLFGFLTENGPFRPTKDGDSVELNEHAWNKVANMLFIEAPGQHLHPPTDRQTDPRLR